MRRLRVQLLFSSMPSKLTNFVKYGASHTLFISLLSSPFLSHLLRSSLSLSRMASIAGSSVAIGAQPRVACRIKAVSGVPSLKMVSFSSQSRSFPSVRMQPAPMRFRVSCAAKPDTLEKVCDIVKKQLALPDDSKVSGASTFQSLGADSLDTVEVVMGLEEAFGISVEEESAQTIATVQDAADLIEKLVEAKSA